MAFTDFPSPNGGVETRGFDSLSPGFTGQPRDCPGPVERASLPLFLPAPAAVDSADNTCLAPTMELGNSPVVCPVKATETAVPLLPEDTAFSLRQWSEALVRPVAEEVSSHAKAPVAGPASSLAGSVSLAALADQLSARFIQDTMLENGGEDLLMGVPVAASPPAALTVPAEESQAELRPVPGLLKPPPPSRPASTPAGIRAAAGLLSNPPRSVPARHQGDVFFLDRPATTAPSVAASLLEAEDFPGLLVDDVKQEPDKLIFTPGNRQEATRDGWASLISEDTPPDLFQTDNHSLPTGVIGDGPEFSASPTALQAFNPAFSTAPPPPLPDFVRTTTLGDEAADSRGVGLILGGAGLLITGIFLACRLPLLWLDRTVSTGWDQHVLESAMLFHAGGALLAMVAGVGSLLQRRGAIQLTLAAGWLAVFSSALLLGITGFLLGSDAEWNLDTGGTMALVASLLLPLAYLLYYEKLSHGFSSPGMEGNNSAPPRSVPLLMVLLSALTVFTGAASLLLFNPALPLPDGNLLTGLGAQAVWSGIAVIAALAAVSAWFRHQAAWWLLLAAVVGVAGTLSVSALAGIPAWSTFLHALGRPAAAAPPGLLWTPALGLAPLILLLVLAMARRAFVLPPSSP